MLVMSAQQAKNPFGELLMKAQREPVEIGEHGKRMAVALSSEKYDQYMQLKLQSLKLFWRNLLFRQRGRRNVCKRSTYGNNAGIRQAAFARARPQ